MIPVFKGTVENGRLRLENREKFDDYLRSLKGKVEIVVRRPKSEVSNPLRRYYFGVILAIPAEHCGMTVKEMHEAMKYIFLRRERDGLIFTRSTANAEGFTNDDMDKLINDVKQFWAERDVFIPDPNAVELPEIHEAYD